MNKRQNRFSVSSKKSAEAELETCKNAVKYIRTHQTSPLHHRTKSEFPSSGLRPFRLSARFFSHRQRQKDIFFRSPRSGPYNGLQTDKHAGDPPDNPLALCSPGGSEERFPHFLHRPQWQSDLFSLPTENPFSVW